MVFFQPLIQLGLELFSGLSCPNRVRLTLSVVAAVALLRLTEIVKKLMDSALARFALAVIALGLDNFDVVCVADAPDARTQKVAAIVNLEVAGRTEPGQRLVESKREGIRVGLP